MTTQKKNWNKNRRIFWRNKSFIFLNFFNFLFSFFFCLFYTHQHLCTLTEIKDVDFYVFLYSNKNCDKALFAILMPKNEPQCIFFKISFYIDKILNRGFRKTTKQSNKNNKLLNCLCIELKFNDEAKTNHDFVMKWDSNSNIVLLKLKNVN